MINVAILGYGTVGAGVYKVLHMNREKIAERVGEELNVRYVLDLRDFPGDPCEDVLTHDYNDILNDPDVAIVVETMGGLRPAFEFTKKAICAGKSVCTSNKELVAEHGVRSTVFFFATLRRKTMSTISSKPAAEAAFRSSTRWILL